MGSAYDGFPKNTNKGSTQDYSIAILLMVVAEYTAAFKDAVFPVYEPAKWMSLKSWCRVEI